MKLGKESMGKLIKKMGKIKMRTKMSKGIKEINLKGYDNLMLSIDNKILTI